MYHDFHRTCTGNFQECSLFEHYFVYFSSFVYIAFFVSSLVLSCYEYINHLFRWYLTANQKFTEKRHGETVKLEEKSLELYRILYTSLWFIHVFEMNRQFYKLLTSRIVILLFYLHFSIIRNQTTDNPVLASVALVGNDVCNQYVYLPL